MCVMCVWVCVWYSHASQKTFTTCGSQFSSIMWILGITLRSVDLVTDTFTCPVFFLVLKFLLCSLLDDMEIFFFTFWNWLSIWSQIAPYGELISVNQLSSSGNFFLIRPRHSSRLYCLTSYCCQILFASWNLTFSWSLKCWGEKGTEKRDNDKSHFFFPSISMSVSVPQFLLVTAFKPVVLKPCRRCHRWAPLQVFCSRCPFWALSTPLHPNDPWKSVIVDSAFFSLMSPSSSVLSVAFFPVMGCKLNAFFQISWFAMRYG